MGSRNQRHWRRARAEAQRKMCRKTEKSSVGEQSPRYSFRPRPEKEGGKSGAAGKPKAEKKIPGNEEVQWHNGEAKGGRQERSRGGVAIPLIQRIGQKRKSRPTSHSRAEAEEFSNRNRERIGQKRKFGPASHTGAEADELNHRTREMGSRNQRRWRRARAEAQRKMSRRTEKSSVGEQSPRYSFRPRPEKEGGKSGAAGKPKAEKKIPGNEEVQWHNGEAKGGRQERSRGGVAIPLIQRIGQKRKSRPTSHSRAEAEELSNRNRERIGQKRKFGPASHTGAEADELNHRTREKIGQKRRSQPASHSRAEAKELSQRNRIPSLLSVADQGARNSVLGSLCREEVPQAERKMKKKKKKKKTKEEGNVLPLARAKMSSEGPRAERIRKKKKKKVEGKVPPSARVKSFNAQSRALGIVGRWISNFEGDPKKLRVNDCKEYLRYHGLRISGTKPLLVDRIKEHIRLKQGRSKIYDRSRFTINCTGDVCKGDVIIFKQSLRPLTRQVEILWSTGYPPLRLMTQMLVKGRKLYRRGIFRQKWEDEGERDRVLAEKHERGDAARQVRSTKPHTCRGNLRPQAPRKPRIKGRKKFERPALAKAAGAGRGAA